MPSDEPKAPEPTVAKPLAPKSDLQPNIAMSPEIIVHDMSQWESEWDVRDKDEITDIIVHHTDMPASAGPADIDAAEVSQGSKGGGYNFYINGDGTIFVLRQIHFMPAAAYGRNRQSINVALGGDFTHTLPNDKQRESFNWLVTHLVNASVPYGPHLFSQEKFKIVHLMGHREVATRFYPNDTGTYATECPGQKLFPVFRSHWIHDIRHLTGRSDIT